MKKLIVPAILILVVIALAVAVIKLITSLAAGILNALIGIIVVLATISLVVWMFAYAKKKRK